MPSADDSLAMRLEEGARAVANANLLYPNLSVVITVEMHGLCVRCAKGSHSRDHFVPWHILMRASRGNPLGDAVIEVVSRVADF